MRNERWYKNLKKAPWSPKPPVFGAVWSVLYIMMAIALYLVWTNKKCYPYCSAIKIFFIQLLLNLIWTTIFFRFKMPILALIDLVAIIVAAGYTYKEFIAIDKTAGNLLIPYLAWLWIAFTLNAYVVVMN
tara:strand:- start:1057 stop:1446 length:390 start_codon:yes stop_codon:yes gene_type:complete